MKALTKKWWFWLIIVIAVITAVVHTYAAIWVRNYVNRKLSEIPGYRAHVSAVTLHLWRGAYRIHDIDIKKTSADTDLPFFSAPVIDLEVQWHALIFERSLVGNIEFQRPKLNFVNAPSKEKSETEVDAPWAQKIKQLFPLKINRFAVHDGEIHYRDPYHNPKVDLPIRHVKMVATNLTNSKKLSKSLIADIRIEGQPMGAGDARTQISLDPYAAKPTFDLNLEIKDLPLPKLNDFAKAYAGITFQSGTLNLATEASAKQGSYHGYVEPVFDHMSVFNPSEATNPLNLIWQGIVEGVTRIVRNYPKDRFGTKIPFAGTFGNPGPDVFATIFNAFRNAFVQAFTGKLEDEHVKVPKVEETKQ
ncbi:MAG TPA: DUF748 domain-containing protein [Chthoniobacterales bacterium]|nr:DUF748 domain-containing protein [Chthoniobacterales bacterium]